MENKPEKTDIDKINELYSLIDNLKSSFQSQISKLSAKVEQQNNQIIELQKKLECNSIKNVINKENINVFEESLIINNNANYISNLKKWISPDGRAFTSKLLFRKSTNGDSFEEFHNLCDKKGKTLNTKISSLEDIPHMIGMFLENGILMIIVSFFL